MRLRALAALLALACEPLPLTPACSPLTGPVSAAAAHELGHAMGLWHSKSPASIMFPSVRPCARIDAEDVAALWAVLPE